MANDSAACGHGTASAVCPACLAPLGGPGRTVRLMSVSTCRSCGLICRLPFLERGKVAEIYTRNYYDSWGGEVADEEVRRQKKLNFRSHLERLSTLQSGGRLLDLGTAKGYFLEMASQMGYCAYGVEISRYAGAIAAERLGKDRIFIGEVEEADFPARWFDIVTMFDFIEHVIDLNAAMEAVTRLLKPGGLLYLVTPDTNSLSHRLMGGNWWHYKEEHLWYFSAASLEALLSRWGLRIITCEPCRKTLSVDYLLSQLATYRVPLVSPLLLAAGKVLPGRFRRLLLKLPSGEIQVLSRKEPPEGPT